MRDIVGGLVAGTLATPEPTVGSLDDGSHLLYAGRTNGLAGESGSGKTWTALRLVQTELSKGANAIFVDFEDTPVGVVGRLLAMGAPAAVIADRERFRYVQPDERFVGVEAAGFMTLIAAMRPTLVVIDSTGESMAIEGSDPNSDDQVARWFQQLPTAIARMGPAVLLLDHLPKADTTAPSPIGSQRKRAAISGVQLIQSVKKGMSFARGRAGEAELVCTKDRAGHFVTGGKAATLVVNPNTSMPDGSGCDVVLVNPSARDWAPTKHMAEVSNFLEKCTMPVNTNKVCSTVTGKRETVTRALKILVASGYATAKSGSRGAIEFTTVKRFKNGDGYVVPDDLAPDADDEAVDTAACLHEWHAGGSCKPGWCHPGHHGRCNEDDESSPSSEEVYSGVIQRAKDDGRLTGRDTEFSASPSPWDDDSIGIRRDDVFARTAS